MKNLKRVFSAVLAMVFVLSAVPVVMAEGETTTVEPEVLFYRDFSDYTGGDPYNQDSNGNAYGVWTIGGDSSYNSAVAAEGIDGTAVKLSQKTNANDGWKAFPKKTDGRIYVAFDLDSSANENASAGVRAQVVIGESTETEGTFGPDIYALTYNGTTNKYVGGSNQYTSSASWQENTTTGVSSDRQNKFELIIDIDNGKIYKYINGVLGTIHDDADYGNMTDVAMMKFMPQSVAGSTLIDNIAILHYPTNVSAQTFSVKSAQINFDDNTFSVFLNSDAVDSDGKGTDTKSSIAAPYGVSLLSTAAEGEAYVLAADSFSVEGLTVTSVTRGARSGEYVVAVEEDIVAGTAYTITAKSGLTDILGASLNENAKTASVSSVAEPEIMFYRDFENYLGGNNVYSDENGLGNIYNSYGTFSFSYDNDFGWSTTTAVNGRTGLGFAPARESTANGSLHKKNFPATVQAATDGQIYISFTSEDIADVDNSGPTSITGTDGHRYFGLNHGTGYTLSGWGASSADTVLPEANEDFYKIDVIFDLGKKVQKTYINNVLVGNKAWNASIENPATSYINFWFENGVIIDNFAMIYYPGTLVPQTYSMNNAKVNDDGTISVFLKSDAVDSDGKGQETKSSIAAPYGIALPSVDASAYTLANDTFSVEGLTVESVTRGAVPGEYVIAVEEEMAENVTYAVTAKAGIEDILGATINSSANSIDVCDVTEPDILFYRDYEDYTATGDSAAKDPFNQSKLYGKANISGDTTWDATTVTDGIDGKAAMLGASHITDGGAVTLKDGKVYFAIDEYVTNTTNREDTIVLNKDTECGVAFGWYPGTKFNDKARNWGSDYSLTTFMNGEGYYRIEGIIDVETGTIDRYINGVYAGQITVRSDSLKGNITAIRFAGSNGNYIDNVTLVHYPEILDVQQTFSLTAAEVNANGTISAFLKSDAFDSDAANGSKLAAPYGATLPSTDTTNAAYTLAADTFSVEGLTVTGVTRGKKSGEYIISVSETLDADTAYTVTAKAGLKDILGSTLNANAASAKTTAAAPEAPKYEISAFELEEGTATVTYTNTTETPEEFVMIVASYVNGIISEIVANNVTAAAGDVDKTETVSLANGVEGKTVKAFLWNSAMKSLAEPNT